MDPVTAAINLGTAIVNNHTEFLKGMTPEQKQQYSQMMIDDMKAWREFIKIIMETVRK